MNSQESIGDESFHLFIAGGEIIGYRIPSQGLAVGPEETGDIGRASASGSTKRTPGGLGRLVYYAASLVHKALVKREVLWRIALRHRLPLRFVAPHHKGLCAVRFIRFALSSYDLLGGRKRLARHACRWHGRRS